MQKKLKFEIEEKIRLRAVIVTDRVPKNLGLGSEVGEMGLRQVLPNVWYI